MCTGSPDAGQLAAQDPDNITAALLAFKDSIAGFDAAIKPSQLEWTSTGLPVCTGDKSNWQHVQCSSGSIVGLNFSQVSLGGQCPPGLVLMNTCFVCLIKKLTEVKL